MFLGIEIGGTKLQIGLGAGDGRLAGLWRGTVDVPAGAAGIRQQIAAAIPGLLRDAGIEREALVAAGIGFGGPVDDATRSVIKSHQVNGWDGFPIAQWLEDTIHRPTRLGNDADVAGLAEATIGAGKGCSPLLYMTIGSGIGGGLIMAGKICRGTGRGAAEIGHLRVRDAESPTGTLDALENIASGWGIGRYARSLAGSAEGSVLRELAGGIDRITAQTVAQAATAGDPLAMRVWRRALSALADAIVATIALVCPQRVVIGGGVSLVGEELLFDPLRALVSERVFIPFAGLTEIVPAQLGEEVVVHGAISLARG